MSKQQNTSDVIGKRILVLGSAPHTRLVTAYTWDDLPSDLNVADYDVVILNLVPFVVAEFARSIDLDTLPSWQQFARLIFSKGSEVTAIGVPGFKIGSNPYLLVEWWLPLAPQVVRDGGEEIRDIKQEFAYYFPYVHQWFFHATGEFDTDARTKDYMRVVDSRASIVVSPTTYPIAQTRFGKPVAFQMQFDALEQRRDGVCKVARSSLVTWLPPTTEISYYEAVDLILREWYGLLFEQTPPPWMEAYRLDPPPISWTWS